MLTCKKAPLAAAAALVIVGLAGCLGGGGSSTPTTPTKVALNGAMVDGYVAGAKVYCDVNGNGTGEATEASTTTDANGNYKFDDCDAPIVGAGGTDAATGFAFVGTLKSPKGAGFMTPITTLMAGANALSLTEVRSLLGVPADKDPTKVDPTKDVGMYKVTLAVQQILVQLASSLGGDYSAIASSLVSSLKASGTALISSEGVLNVTALQAAAKAAATASGKTLSDADLAAMASSLKSQADQYLSVKSLDELVAKAKKLQDPANPETKIDPTAASKYFALVNDSISIDGQAYSLTDLQSTAGVTLTGFDKIGVSVDVSKASALGTSALALSLVEVGGAQRELRVALDKANLSLADGKLALAIPSDAKVYLYGKKAKGDASTSVVTFSGPLSGAAKNPVAFSNNQLTIDYSAVVNRALTSVSDADAPTLKSYLAVKGVFNVTAVISNFNLRLSNGAALTQKTLQVTDDAPAVYGSAITGKITVN